MQKSSCANIDLWLNRRKIKKLNWHFLTIAGEPVGEIFIKLLVIVKSRDCLLRDSSGHASVVYNNTDKHLERSRPKTTSSEAKRPTLPYTALNALKKRELAWLKLHLNVRALTKNKHSNSSQPIWSYRQKWKLNSARRLKSYTKTNALWFTYIDTHVNVNQKKGCVHEPDNCKTASFQQKQTEFHKEQIVSHLVFLKLYRTGIYQWMHLCA